MAVFPQVVVAGHVQDVPSIIYPELGRSVCLSHICVRLIVCLSHICVSRICSTDRSSACGRLYSWGHLVKDKFSKFQKKDLCVMLNESGVVCIGLEQVITGLYTREHTIHEVSSHEYTRVWGVN